jgi:hypothetical protein
MKDHNLISSEEGAKFSTEIVSCGGIIPPKSLLDGNPICACGDKEFDHRVGAKGKRGACRMCITCKKFKLPKPIKSKIK